MTLTDKAEAFAAKRYGDQRRKYTEEPHTAHLGAVVRILEQHGIQEPIALAGAWLHDAVEDTDTSIAELVDTFGEEVAKLVYWLTGAEKGNRKARTTMSAWRLGCAPWQAIGRLER